MLLRPFLKHMTKSELHTIMSCGFASIAGGVMGTYVQFGVRLRERESEKERV